MKIVDENKKNEALSWARRLSGMLREKGEITVADEVDGEIADFETHKLTIAVVGLLKRGKSTFCNAWLKRKDDLLAPVDFIPATGVISNSCIRKSVKTRTCTFSNKRIHEGFPGGRFGILPPKAVIQKIVRMFPE